MDVQTALLMEKAIWHLNAAEQIDRIQAASYPNMEQSAATKYYRGVFKQANPSLEETDNEAAPITSGELAKIVGAKLRGK